MPRRPTALLLVLTALAAAGCAQDDDGGSAAPASGARASARVERVVDGDTIIVRDGGHRDRVRLIGIDTPETVKPGGPVECFGRQASAETERLLDGRTVKLEYDVETTDGYGRRLAYVFREPDGLFVNEALVRGGYAERYRNTPNRRYVDQLIAAQRAAERADAGLWRSCPR